MKEDVSFPGKRSSLISKATCYAQAVRNHLDVPHRVHTLRFGIFFGLYAQFWLNLAEFKPHKAD